MSILDILVANVKLGFPLLCSNIKDQVKAQHLAMETLMSN